MADAPKLPTSAFADEAAPDLAQQLDTLLATGIRGIDVRWLDGVNVTDLDDAALDRIRTETEARGLVVQAVGSPVNKVPFAPENRDVEMEKLRKSVHAAEKLGTKNIRIFSPATGEDREAAWPGVREWMADQVALAADHGILLLHENDAKYYGAYPDAAKRLLDSFSGPNFKFAFDFANTVNIGLRPDKDWFPWIFEHVHTLHIKDAVEETHKVVPAGEGDGQVVQTMKWMFERGWNGPLTLEPHLQAAGPMGGYSGPQLFEVAANALKKCVAEAGGELA